ncbi:nitric oxide reductase activation protein NorD [Hyphomicrobium sp.]|uniref:nitric oxide reductase activation protein NorD n=1 Tax=Hyphomicrobium sp. TaxID=82 RepID=UPI002D79E021|nr:VWA domain-containing protein [Hyphomicrobium sp.]HET6390350.1 VWA domain-containing protein [Hyphomicrobium sp.]
MTARSAQRLALPLPLACREPATMNMDIMAATQPVADASKRLIGLMSARRNLVGAFHEIWDLLGLRLAPGEREAWAKAALQLVDVNAGPGCLSAYWRLSSECDPREGLDYVIEVGAIAADICRHAGARATASVLKAERDARVRLVQSEALVRWWRAMARLAREAPDCVEPLSQRTSDALASASIETFEQFVSVGLKKSGKDRAGRRAFFALEDEIARQLVQGDRNGARFADEERDLNLFLTALWGREPKLRALGSSENGPRPRRANIAGSLIRLPEHLPDVSGETARHFFRASAAHASAHLALGGPPFIVGSLRPIQVALVNIIEDARIEALAMERLPGLRSLWAPYHVAQARDGNTAEAIMARLARALFDPAYKDDNGIVAKGRHLFEAARGRLADPDISREIGGLLGNDLGQTRVQFNAKAHVVEPAYRDDGMGLWDFAEDSRAASETHEIAIDAARMERREESDAPRQNDPSGESHASGRAKPVTNDERGIVIARYPEWDRASGLERQDWATLRELAPSLGDPRRIESALAETGSLRARIGQLVRRARVGRPERLKRQADGHDLDFDAVLDAGIALRTGDLPDPRIFRSSGPGVRSMAVAILIDVSESTRDVTENGNSVLDAECMAVAALAEAMKALGDPFALMAFASNGHDDVRLTQVKTFKDAYDRDAVSRLAALKPALSTRLGAALRHAGAVLDGVASYRKLVIALTDGEPSDIDVHDPLDLVEDARRATINLRGRGIDSFGVVVGSSAGSAPAIFGRANAMPVRRIEELPQRLSELYFRLSRR